MEEAVGTARRILSSVEEPMMLPDGYEIVASVCLGVALTKPGQSADDILRDADVAMYKASKGRGGTYQVFDKAADGQPVVGAHRHGIGSAQGHRAGRAGGPLPASGVDRRADASWVPKRWCGGAIPARAW